MRRDLEQAVRARAGGLCEYCRRPEAPSPVRFVIDHVIARQHRGPTVLENLAVACDFCNLHKGPNVAGYDPEGGQLTRLYHLRQDMWSDHFRWEGAVIVGLTRIGRTTVEVLAMNDPDQVALRNALIEEGVFPPAG